MTTPSEPGGPGQEGPSQPFEPMPAAPALNEQESALSLPVDRPKSVRIAFILWLAVVTILLIGVVLVLTASDESLRDASKSLLDQQGKKNPTEQEIVDGVKLVRGVGIGFNLLFAVLVLAFAFPMRSGRNWGRIALCVVGGILFVLSLLNGGGNLLFVLLQLIFIATAVVFMFRPEAKPYFASRR